MIVVLSDIKVYTEDGKELMDVTIFLEKLPVDKSKGYFTISDEGWTGKWKAGKTIELDVEE